MISIELQSTASIFRAAFYKNTFGGCLCMYWCIFFSILQIYKDSQFNNTKIKNSKIQVQNKTQALRKSYAFLNKACTCRGHININNNNNDNNNDNDDNNNNNNNNNIIIIIIIIKYIYIYKKAEREKR